MWSVAFPGQDAESRSPRSETLGLIPSRAESWSALSGRCQYLRKLSKSPLEPQLVATPSPSSTDTDSESIMVVRSACQTRSGCSADSYFTTYQQAASHFANSAKINQSLRGIGTVVLPSRPTDVEAGGSGAAEAWAGPQRRWGLCCGSGSAQEVISCYYIRNHY